MVKKWKLINRIDPLTQHIQSPDEDRPVFFLTIDWPRDWAWYACTLSRDSWSREFIF